MYDECDETDYLKLARPWIAENATTFEKAVEEEVGSVFFARGAAQLIWKGNEKFIETYPKLKCYDENALCYLYTCTDIYVDEEVKELVMEYWGTIYEDYIDRTPERLRYL
jgi:hypothetical protein